MEKGERVAVGCISFVELVLCMVYGKYYIRGWSEASLLSVSFFVCIFIYCVALDISTRLYAYFKYL